MLANVIYMDLRIKWDIEELNYICHALGNNCDNLDLHVFTDHRSAYLDHIKIWYYLEKNNG